MFLSMHRLSLLSTCMHMILKLTCFSKCIEDGENENDFGENENNLGENENFSNINQHLPLPFLFPPSLPLLPPPLHTILCLGKGEGECKTDGKDTDSDGTNRCNTDNKNSSGTEIDGGVSSGCETDSGGISGYEADDEVSDIEDGGESGSPVMQETGDPGSDLIIIPTFQHHNSEGSLVRGR